MTQVNDLSRCLTVLEQDSTLIAVIEMSLDSWLVGGLVPGLSREPAKKIGPDGEALVQLLYRWREEAWKAGKAVERITVAYEAGRDGFWLARWLRARGIECHVIHSASVAVSRERRRAKTDRLDVALLKRSFLGWLRGEKKHCQMVEIPTLAVEDARRPGRERERLVSERTRVLNWTKSVLIGLGIRGFNPKLRKAPEKLAALRTPEGGPLPANSQGELRRAMARLAQIRAQLQEIEQERAHRLAAAQEAAEQARAARMVLLLTRIVGLGLDTAEILVHEVFWRNLRDAKAVGRYGGLTGTPDESGRRRREKGLAKAGNARVRKAMLQLAWRFVWFQKDSALAQWFLARTRGGHAKMRKTMIVALAHRLLIALWCYARTGVLPAGIVLRAAA